MGDGDSASAPRSLQAEILERTWVALRKTEFDEELTEKLVGLADAGRISYSTEIIAAIEASVRR